MASREDPPAVLEKFPALERLQHTRRKQVPFVQQLEAADCGAACLTMVLRFWGHDASLDQVREVVGTSTGGTDALSLLRGAEWFGFRGRGLKLDMPDLRYLQPGSILHWEFDHFVVFESVSRHGVQIIDPAFGRRLVPTEKFSGAFTGVALVLEPTEAFEPTGPGRSRVFGYLRGLLSERRLISRVVVTSIMLRLFALALPVLTALVVDRVVPRSDSHLLLVVGVGLAGVLVFQLLSELIRAHLLLQLRTNLDTRMTLGFLDHLVSLPYEFFQKRSSGDLLMRVNSNTVIREQLTASTLSALLDGGLVVLYLGFVFVISPPMGALVAGLGVLQVIVFLLARRRYRELMSQDLEAQARAQSYLVQVLAGIETLKVYGGEQRAIQHWSNLFVDELNVALKRGRLAAFIESLKSTLLTGSPLVVLTYGAVLVMNGQLTLGTMLAVNALAVGFLMPLGSLVDSALRLQILGSYIERIDDVLSAEVEQDAGSVAPAPKLSGRVEIRNVSFRYSMQAPLVVRDASLVIEPGMQIAVVGKSGSGKSTLASLLLGLYRPTEGTILFDGHNLADLDMRSVRRQLGVVMQHPFIFSGSIRDNIALADPSAPRERLVAAARAACIDDDIATMAMGYETLVADGGSTLSGGQRQRLALARALVSRPSILLLDEATSALDARTERQVQQQLDSLRCTRIVIAHRLSTVVGADLIVVMDQGRIAEVGRHAELVAAGGVYADLIASQAELGAAEASA
ncbi:MAG TPA: peptidase domain-containing ABC transporter [Kofleriaceae bacterium]|nr:peptidase domain-containing ABC transporter [Kofleriaceae bacterium]